MKQKLLSCTVCGLILGLLEICSGHEIPLSWTNTIADKDIVQFSDKSFQDCVVDCWRRLECNVIYYRATSSHCILSVHSDLTAVARVPAQYVYSHKSEWAEAPMQAMCRRLGKGNIPSYCTKDVNKSPVCLLASLSMVGVKKILGNGIIPGKQIKTICDDGGAFQWTCAENGSWKKSRSLPTSLTGMNIALGKPAWQSTTRPACCNAGVAVDGNTNGDFSAYTCTHTEGSDAMPYWAVDLGTCQTTRVKRLTLFNRRDGPTWMRLRDFVVILSDDREFRNTNTHPTYKCAEQIGPPTDSTEIQLVCSHTEIARYLMIKKTNVETIPLILCEVQVFI